VEKVGMHENICPYLHLPVQSGSDGVLRRMGRGYTREQYLDLVRQLRAARPDLALSTDIIVGFPGESDGDFQQTLDLLEETRFASVFAFTYSPRPGTAAPRLDAQVDPGTAAERLQRIFACQEKIQKEINLSLVGKEYDVVVTGWGREAGMQMGRTPCHRITHFATGEEPAELGSVIRVRIAGALAHSLKAERLTTAGAA